MVNPNPISNLTEEERKKLTCPICKNTFPDKRFYDSHHLYEAKFIADMFEEEAPGFVGVVAKIENNQREIREIDRNIEFLKGISKRQATFELEQQNHEIAFLDGIKQSAIEFKEEKQQRKLRKERMLEELKCCLRDGKTPSVEGLYRLVSED
jgi:hypothetical protein